MTNIEKILKWVILILTGIWIILAIYQTYEKITIKRLEKRIAANKPTFEKKYFESE